MQNSMKKEFNNEINSENGLKYITFNSNKPCGIEKVDLARAVVFGEKKSDEALIFIHGMGYRNFKPLTFYPKYFNKYGIDVVMPVLPYYYERSITDKNGKKIEFLSGNSEEIENRFYQAVDDVICCIDYLQLNGYKTINIMGFSFGGMIATIVMAKDKRINKASIAVSGGNFEYITWKSVATKILRIKYEEDGKCNNKKCHEIHKKYDYYIEKFNLSSDHSDIPSCIRYDPSTFASKIDTNCIIMFSAIFDEFIPKKSSDDLWKRLGKPKRYNILSGHITSHLLYKKYIGKKSLEFFKNL